MLTYLGWPPSQFNDLPARERALVKMFALRSMEENKKQEEELKRR